MKYSNLLKPYIYKEEARDAHGRWTKIGNNLGSNPGGAHTSPTGEKHYVKFPPNEQQIHSEVASDKIHELVGGKTINHEAKEVNGKLASVTKWNSDLKPLGRQGWANMNDKQKQQAANIFMGSALTNNWDVVGLVHDNMCKNTKTGDIHIVDTGGAFKFRAQGGPKDFGGDANKEIDNFLNPEKTSGGVFSPMMKSNPEVFKKAAENLKGITKEHFEEATKGLKDQSQIVDTLMQRRKVIMDRFGVK